MRASTKFAAACMLGVLAFTSQRAATAAELIILTNQGATPGVTELANAFSRATGHKVTVIQDGGLAGGAAVADPLSPALNQRLDSGPADLVTANPEQIEALAKQGKIVPGTAVPFVIAGLGLSVRTGLPKPDISTVEAYKSALRAAKSIGYSRGCSGTHAAEGIAKLGIADELRPKTVLVDGGPVVEYLAKGDFDIGIQQTNIMVGAPGTEYVGPLPGYLNDPCPSSVALLNVSKEPEASRAMIKFMISPEAAPLLRKTHVEPAKP
jgi:molybdate transport system substrate-binding protein